MVTKNILLKDIIHRLSHGFIDSSNNALLITFFSFPWQNGSHMFTKHLITGHYLYNFSYGTDGQLSGLTCRNGHGLQVRRDAHGVPLWLALPGGQVYWLSLSNSGTLRKVSAQGHDIAHITYHGNTGLLATKSDENSWTTVYEWVCSCWFLFSA